MLAGIAAIAMQTGIAPASAADVHPIVEAAAQSGTLHSVLLIMRQQADLSAASQLTTKVQKGAFVLQAVQAMANQTQPAVLAQIRGLGLKPTPFYVMNAIFVESAGGLSISSQQVQTLAANVGVASLQPTDAGLITPVVAPTTQSAGFRGPSGPIPSLTAIGATALWAQGDTGQGIVVGTSDTGVALHPDLVTKYRGYAGPGKPTYNDYNWWDASTVCTPASPCCSSPCDFNGHGTHTTGTMVASNPVFQVGVAPGAKWIGCRSLGGGASAGTVLVCLQFMLAPWDHNGLNPDPSKAPDVLNNSYFCNSCDLESAFGALQAAGIMALVGNGNVGPRCRSVEEPADYSNTTGVGATNNFDVGFDTIAFFSANGPTGANLVKPDLVAPGVNILSTCYLPHSDCQGSPNPPVAGYPRAPNGYVYMSGTSMATPHVSGAVALLWSARPELRGNVAATLGLLGETATHIVDTTCNNAPPVFSPPYLLTVPNDIYGWGLINVLAAVQSKWGSN
jgi:subtilisin family serine protease